MLLALERFRRVYEWDSRKFLYDGPQSKCYRGVKFGFNSDLSRNKTLDLPFVIKKVPIKLRYQPGGSLCDDLISFLQPLLIQMTVQGKYYVEIDAITLDYVGSMEEEKCPMHLYDLYIAIPEFGKSLKDARDDRAPTKAEFGIIIKFAVKVLMDLKQRNIAHRDIKPQNILVQDDHHLRLVDFGEARIGTDLQHSITVAGFTPEYMDPAIEDIIRARLNPNLQQWQAHDEFSMGMTLLAVACNPSQVDLVAARANPSTLLKQARESFGDLATIIQMMLQKKDVLQVKQEAESILNENLDGNELPVLN